MTRTPRTPFLMTVGLVALGACGGADDADAPTSDAPDAGPVPAASPAPPDATADAVWAYLQAQNYGDWDMLPGLTEYYQGGAPHGALLTTRGNREAVGAIPLGDGQQVPANSMYVKENFGPDSTLMAVTVMYKVQGFNPEHQDWWFLKRNMDGSVDVAGRGAGCESCHAGAPGGDYLFMNEGPAGG